MRNISVTEWLHHFIGLQVQKGDLCIDATMGNGGDTVLLSRLAGEEGKVLAFDIQEIALERTKARLVREDCPFNYELLPVSHEKMAQFAKEGTVSCITFNLGYLPGGDHRKATRADTSQRAISEGLKLLKKGGLMTVCLYSGGDTGFEEKDRILKYLEQLPGDSFLVISSEYRNRPNHPPTPVLIIRQ